MSRIVSIVLIGCFMFNMIGYKLLFYYQITEADSRIQARIESLDESKVNLFSVKIPIRLPYHTDWKDFESVEGEMTYNNKTYRYVKRKVLRDTLILLCIEHHEKSLIERNRIDFAKKVNEVLPDGSKKQIFKHAKEDFYQKSGWIPVTVYSVRTPEDFPVIQALKTSSYHQKIDRPPSIEV